MQKLIRELEKEINIRLKKIGEYGTTIKELLKAERPQKEIDIFYREMARIIKELEPILPLVQRYHPKHANLFDMLLMYDNKPKRKNMKMIAEELDNRLELNSYDQ